MAERWIMSAPSVPMSMADRTGKHAGRAFGMEAMTAKRSSMSSSCND